MKTNALIVQGIVKSDGSLEIDEKLPLSPGRVQVTVQPLPDLSQDPFWQRMESIWLGQQARGFAPRSDQEVQCARQALQEDMEEEIQQTIELQRKSRQERQQRVKPEEPAAE